MSELEFWKKALMCVDVCLAAYQEGDASRQTVRQYVYDYDEYKKFSVNTSQATCIKTLDHEYIIGFRGTDDLESALLDIKTWQTQSETVGDVHYGFKKYLDDIYAPIIKWLESYSVREQKKKIIVTGHSLGGAAATIMAARLKHNGYEHVELYTYGSPRVGDKTFVSQFEGMPVHRFVNNNDIVCRIPPPVWYRHIGEMHYVNYAGNFVKYTMLGRAWDRFRSRIRALVKLEIFDGTYDHPAIWYRKRIDEQVQRIKSHSQS